MNRRKGVFVLIGFASCVSLVCLTFHILCTLFASSWCATCAACGSRVVREETPMDGHRTSFHRHCTTSSHRSSGVGGLDERPKLRFEERNRVREPRSCGSNWTSHWTGRETIGEITRPVQCAHQRSGEIFHDGSSDRSSRRQEEVGRIHTVGRESGVRDARYGLRGVRVGEASHPGPQGRRIRDISDAIWWRSLTKGHAS